MRTKAKIEEFLRLAEEIERDCFGGKIECYECPLNDGSLCTIHSNLTEEIEDIENEFEERFEEECLNDDMFEILEEVVEKIELIKKAYGSDLSVIIEGEDLNKSKSKKIQTYLFFNKYEEPVAIFGIAFNMEDRSVEVLETEDLGGRM